MFGKKESLESERLEVGSFREARSRIISTYFLEKTKTGLNLQGLCAFVHMDIYLINIPVLRWRMGIQGRGEDTE